MNNIDLLSDVETKIKKRNTVLFSRDSACLQELLDLIQQQKHRTLVMWALDCAQTPLDKLAKRQPAELRTKNALDISRLWARGEVKMPTAKSAILAAHAAAKDMTEPADAALCHAIGHACATVHVESHAIGLPMYELTAIVMDCGYRDYQNAVLERIGEYHQRLLFWQVAIDKSNLTWAKFLMDDDRPNKERLVREKQGKGENPKG